MSETKATAEETRGRKYPMWAIATFILGVGLQWTILRNGGVTKLLSGLGMGSQVSSTSVATIPDKVVIGVVSCQKPGTGNVYNEEAALMMKSVIVSALLYDLPRLEFHLFLEDIPAGRKFFRGKLKEWGFPKETLKVALHYHSAFDAVPEKYHDQMIYDTIWKKYRCGFVRHFFPTALPGVESIIYLDTDMIITGNIASLWNHLGRMTGDQMVGVARNNEPEADYDHIEGFGDIPYVPPKGVNSGMMVMNLTRMRDYDWQTRVIRLYEDYTKTTRGLEDQRLLNIILYYDPSIHQLVPCNYDLMHTNCDKGWVCPPALKDSHGVHVIHGAGEQFELGGSFHAISEAYKAVRLDGKVSKKFLLEEVALPIIDAYDLNSEDKSKPDSLCYGTLNKQLFKNWEPTLLEITNDIK